MPVDRRRHRDRTTRLTAILHGFGVGIGLKGYHRLTLARTMMERKLLGRRACPNLPGRIDLAWAACRAAGGFRMLGGLRKGDRTDAKNSRPAPRMR
ncbi:hypothetical protein [Sinorhizobium medicae]|uniref:hypothetical protein n=1 Tax=Sinorhizobium medicae TaxID=110321 RepID=UPI00399A9728